MSVAELLLTNRAELEVKDSDGWTPLHAASCWGQVRTASTLESNIFFFLLSPYCFVLLFIDPNSGTAGGPWSQSKCKVCSGGDSVRSDEFRLFS